MRASTGKAVMLMAMPRNKTKGMLPMPWGAKRMRRECASRAAITKGDEDARAAGGHGGAALVAELGVVEVHADEEEEEDEADGGEEFELRQ